MNNNFKSGVFIFILGLTLFLPEAVADSGALLPDPEPPISMDFKDVSLKDILKIFSVQSGLNFIASEALQDRKITLYLDKVPLEKAMDKLFKANNLSYELDREANIFIVKDWGKPTVETVTQIFYLKYATVSSSSLKEEMGSQIRSTQTTGSSATGEQQGGGQGGGQGEGKWAVEEDAGITKVVKKILSEFGSVMEDFRTNSLIVTDIPSRMETIAKTIAALDVPAPQVMLEVEMLDVSKNKVDKMGINWGSAGSFSMQVISASRGTGFPLSGFNPSDARVHGPVSTGTVSFPTTLKLILDFLRTQTDTRYLARPRLLTLNNETAEIKITTQETVGEKLTYDENNNIQDRTAERAETGVSLRVTPQINLEKNEITMFIVPKVTEATASSFTSASGATYRDPEERGTKTLVRIKDGETVIIGGLIRNEFLQTSVKIPILGDIPLLGALFRHKGGGSSSSDKNKERELLVFITPHIVRDANIELAQAEKPTLPEREQNTISGIDRQAIVSTSLSGFEKKR